MSVHSDSYSNLFRLHRVLIRCNIAHIRTFFKIGAGHQVTGQALDHNPRHWRSPPHHPHNLSCPVLTNDISSSILSIKNNVGDVVATAFVWNYSTTEVFLLTNYHKWTVDEFNYCFPPSTNKKRTRNGNKSSEQDPQHLTLSRDNFEHEFVLESEMFQFYEKEYDFAVLKFPIGGFNMPKIRIRLDDPPNLEVHAVGYIGHNGSFSISSGQVVCAIPEGFGMNMPSTGGLSNAAIIADTSGRAVGYMGVNLNTSWANNEHLSYAYRFDHLMIVTNRDLNHSKLYMSKGSSCDGKTIPYGTRSGILKSEKRPSEAPTRACKKRSKATK